MSFGNIETSSNQSGKSPQERIAYQGKLKPFLQAVLLHYDNGEYVGHEIKQNGYEDFNIVLNTSQEDIFLKCFAHRRSREDCERYLDMIEAAIGKGGVQTPKLYSNTRGNELSTIDIDGLQVHVCAMKYLDGGNIWESERRLTKAEQVKVIHEAAKINSCEYTPPFVHDSWAITNAQETYSKNRQNIGNDDRILIDRLMKELGALNISSLPHAFVHGDIRSTNIMRHNDGNIYVIDFSVANWYPRVVELAVIFSDILFDPDNLDQFDSLYRWTLKEYQSAGATLTSGELKVLPTFIRLAHAMNVIGSSSVNATQFISQEENQHWMDLGRQGLKFTMDQWSRENEASE